MDQLPQAAVVTSVSHSAPKGTLDTAANRTTQQPIGVVDGVRRKHALAANRTDLAPHRIDRSQTLRAYRKPGDVQQGLAADAAVGRKQNGEQTFGGAPDPDTANPFSIKHSPGKGVATTG